MDKQITCSPFLPGWEYVADGEPHVFGDRLYIFGSHDRFNGKRFCMKDYVVWSAPLNNLSAWECAGTSYRKNQDPDNKDGKCELWAPDVAQGADGRFYLYYCLANKPQIGVAVSDKPEGPYEFLDHVHDKNGGILGKRPGDVLPFDPGVLVDRDGSVHLYEGQAPMFENQVKRQEKTRKFPWHVELEPDMVTIRIGPTPIIPNLITSKGTGFEGHEFFEANSIRRFGDKYYYIYSSIQAHELCWAISDRPDSGFRFGGTLVSNGDIGFHGPAPAGSSGKASLAIRNYIGNNHGSVELVNGRYYVFYHRQTNRHMYSRQACVAPIEMLPDGSFKQAEMTSSGLADSLPGKGKFDARIACELYSRGGALFSSSMIQNIKHPAFTQDEKDGESGKQYIANLRDGATAVFKYFDFDGNETITVTVRGKGAGRFLVRSVEGSTPLAVVPLKLTKTWTTFRASFCPLQGRHALYFTYEGRGFADFMCFELR